MRIKGHITKGKIEYIEKEVIVQKGLCINEVDANGYPLSVSITDQDIPPYLMNAGASGSGKSLTQVTFFGDIKTIGKNAFEGCTLLERIPLIEGIETIGDNAFNKCITVTEVQIPKTVKTLGNGAFAACTSLNEVTIRSDDTNVSGQYSYPFNGCNAIREINFDVDMTVVPERLFYGCGIIDLEIPYHIKNIGKYSFAGCKQLGYLTLNPGLETIERNAFDSDPILDVTIPETVITIGADAFYKNTALQTLEFLATDCVTDSTGKPFEGCSNLISITFSDKPMNIGDKMFSYTGIEYIYIPGNVNTIGQNAFSTSEKAKSVLIAEGVKSIKSYAFGNCKALETIKIPESVTELGTYSFTNAGTETENGTTLEIGTGTAFIYGNNSSAFLGAKLSSITFGPNVSEISSYTFAGCTINNLHIPHNVKKLGIKAFYNSTINTLTFDEGITEIGADCFYNSKNITSLELPATLTNINSTAFNNCTGITTITVKGDSIPANAPWGATNATVELVGE